MTMRNKLFFTRYFYSIFLILLIFWLFDLFFGDNQIFLFINQKIASPTLDFLCLYIFVPLFFLLGIIPLLMLFFRKLWRIGLLSLISGFICYELGNLLKILICQPRPLDVLPVRIVGSWVTDSFSFPSTTTMLAIGLALPILIWKPRYGLPLLVLAFSVGFFVIYTGFHFPQDVIVGAMLSLTIVFLIEQLRPRIRFLRR